MSQTNVSSFENIDPKTILGASSNLDKYLKGDGTWDDIKNASVDTSVLTRRKKGSASATNAEFRYLPSGYYILSSTSTKLATSTGSVVSISIPNNSDSLSIFKANNSLVCTILVGSGDIWEYYNNITDGLEVISGVIEDVRITVEQTLTSNSTSNVPSVKAVGDSIAALKNELITSLGNQITIEQTLTSNSTSNVPSIKAVSDGLHILQTLLEAEIVAAAVHVEQNLSSNSTISVPSVKAVNDAISDTYDELNIKDASFDSNTSKLTITQNNNNVLVVDLSSLKINSSNNSNGVNINRFSVYTVTVDGAQSIQLPSDAIYVDKVQVKEFNSAPNNYISEIWMEDYSLVNGNLIISAEANLKVGDKIIGTYFTKTSNTSTTSSYTDSNYVETGYTE